MKRSSILLTDLIDQYLAKETIVVERELEQNAKTGLTKDAQKRLENLVSRFKPIKKKFDGRYDTQTSAGCETKPRSP